jgi:hypothetical protein
MSGIAVEELTVAGTPTVVTGPQHHGNLLE